MILGSNLKALQFSKSDSCDEIYSGNFFGINAQKLLDLCHFLSSGVVSFARGLNDTPQIVGLLLVINTLDLRYAMIAIALMMSIGGLLNAKKLLLLLVKKLLK